MSKQVNTKAVEVVGEVQEALFYTPTDIQRRMKANFWVKQADAPFLDVTLVTLRQVIQITGCAKLKDWWDKPGFRSWFLNQDEQRQKLEYLYGLALDTLQEMLINTDPKAQGARVKAVQLIAELANKVPKKDALDVADRAIQAMDRQALLAYLEKSGIQLPGAKPARSTASEQIEAAKED